MSLKHSLLFIFVLLTSCVSDDVENAYSSLRAFFSFRFCATVPQMRAALNGSPGAFFTVRATADNKYVITSNTDPGNPFTYQKDALDEKMTFQSIAGFVIGTPTYSSSLEVFDLGCPNCFRNSISRPLSFQSSTRLKCSRCHCVYSLDNAPAILVEGDGQAKVLHRYHAAYDGLNNLSVQN